ncbi:L-threonylcarbamoyladenylate synthase [Lacimicrobium alkaliphilum]|uniref:Threonylcarbamoyl-AMP synthase n=1 Tax=Lacimicrobium alkaliphilum TaxID=1526571 RepID=A0ABQ1RIW1_9ALTE|nr:L-threonylcarbamoyladenylate synthase [Lacimicrobium alkaliphilum]GGD68498.1 threonylcarbamoyl-AMP synthase [Lacimicrobium alkaliphilum]
MNRLKLDGEISQDISRAVALLREGELVAIPTETVYGLAADASNEQAVGKVFSAKRRPLSHPLIVHVGEPGQLSEWATDIPALAWQLAEQFWPGPLTLILKKSPMAPAIITGGQDTIALRIPGHPVALAILKEFGGALAAPSANRYGRISPTAASHVFGQFGDDVMAVVDGGLCPVGIESSIVDLSTEEPRILRPGLLDGELVKAGVAPYRQDGESQGPRVSGSDLRHYAPVKPASLCPPKELKTRIEQQSGGKIQVWSLTPNRYGLQHVDWVVMPVDPAFYARELYLRLHDFENSDNDLLIIEQPPVTSLWRGINNRLQRATRLTTEESTA